MKSLNPSKWWILLVISCYRMKILGNLYLRQMLWTIDLNLCICLWTVACVTALSQIGRLFIFLISFFLRQATKKRVRQDLSLAQTLTAGILEEAAKIRNDESILIHIRGRDCVALEARYHKRCYQRYTKCLSNKPRDIGPTLYDQAFDEFCMEVIEARILQNKEILLLSYLLKKFIRCVQKIENTQTSYQAARL